jgi:two-component system, OmpR family, copper resistance phosphate regulon response regulator CusR
MRLSQHVPLAVGMQLRNGPLASDGTDLGRILVVEDEPRVSSLLARGLAKHGFTTEVAESGEAALVLARSGRFDLVILDVGLPTLDGFDVLRVLRAGSETLPIVMLTARGTVRDTVAGLDAGADDYITKPFRFRELVASVRLQLGRERATASPDLITVADATLDVRGRRVIVAGEPVDLSPREFALAETFFRNAGEVLSRSYLLDAVWGGVDPGSNIVDVYVGYLRRKLGKRRIASLRGRGYRLETDTKITAA